MVVWPDDLESEVPNKDMEQRIQAANSHRFLSSLERRFANLVQTSR
jgi:hypothetical protein